VVDGALIPRPAALTAVAVTGQNGVAMSAEPPAGVSGLPVAAAAQPGDGRVGPTAAEQAPLARIQQGLV
jgi:hypothetical protein